MKKYNNNNSKNATSSKKSIKATPSARASSKSLSAKNKKRIVHNVKVPKSSGGMMGNNIPAEVAAKRQKYVASEKARIAAKRAGNQSKLIAKNK